MLWQSLKMAWEAVRSNKMRSFLTMLGIIIGVFSLTVLVSVVSSATNSINTAMSRLVTPSLYVTIVDDKGLPLTVDELKAMENKGNVGLITSSVQTNMRVKSAYEDKLATVNFVLPECQTVQGLNVAHGRFLMQPDVDNHTAVVVVSADVATKVMQLARPQDALGELVTIGGNDFTVVGVLESQKSDVVQDALFWQDNYICYIPFTTAERVFDGVDGVHAFTAIASEDGDLSIAADELGAELKERFHNDEEAFQIYNNDEALASFSTITSALSLLMGSVAGISLLVGGIGIMNIMLVSVSERTREIGIRKAIGATRGTILQQFLMESLMISLMGCVVGVALSWVALTAASAAIESMDFVLAPSVVLLSAGFSTVIGLIFGMYPANKAAKMKPIDALRAV